MPTTDFAHRARAPLPAPRWPRPRLGPARLALVLALLAGGGCPRPPAGPSDGGDGGADGPTGGPRAFAFALGSSSLDFGKAIAVDTAGNVYVTGFIGGPVDFDLGPGSFLRPATTQDIFLARYSPRAELQWAVSLTTAGFDLPHSVHVARGRVTLSGYFNGTIDFDPGPGVVTRQSAGGRDAFVAQYDAANGQLVWVSSFGGPGDDEVTEATVDGAGNVRITGSFTGTIDLDPSSANFLLTAVGPSAGPVDTFVATYAEDGSFVRALQLGNTGEGGELGQAIAGDAAGNHIVAGTFTGSFDCDPGPGTRTLTSLGGPDLFIARFLPSGEQVSCVSLGGTGFDVVAPGGIDLDPTGGFVLTGHHEGTVDFDPGAGLAERTSAGGDDLFLARYGSDGALLWAFDLGAAPNDGGHRARFAPGGDVLVGGWFRGSIDADPGAGTATLRAQGDVQGTSASDLLVARYAADGSYRWARGIGSGSATEDSGLTSNTLLSGLTVGSAGEVYFTGRFYGGADLDPGPGALPATSSGASDIVFGALDASGALVTLP